MSAVVPLWHSTLRFLLLSTLLLQTAITLASMALGHANAEAGLLKYRLPQFLFWVYVWVGIAAPTIALVTLITLWATENSVGKLGRRASGKPRQQMFALCVLNVGAAVLWFYCSGQVFFAAGGGR